MISYLKLECNYYWLCDDSKFVGLRLPVSSFPNFLVSKAALGATNP
jgi:hypothetical protein